MLTGGLAEEPFVAPALAAALDRPVELAAEPEATLLGAARLADPDSALAARGRVTELRAAQRIVEPGKAGRYLRAKYRRWRAWLSRLLVR